jgi:hypothetical protein
VKSQKNNYFKQNKMKNFTKVFAIAIAMFGFAASSFAQNNVSATATASATIVNPISIASSANINFGDIAVQSNTAGTVVLASDGERTATDGVTLPSSATTTTSAAEFTVQGEGAYSYAITLPETCTITEVDGAETMTLSDFSCSITDKVGALTNGTQTFTVGATLAVSAGQAAAVYSNETGFAVTVNYN